MFEQGSTNIELQIKHHLQNRGNKSCSVDNPPCNKINYWSFNRYGIKVQYTEALSASLLTKQSRTPQIHIRHNKKRQCILA